MSTVSVSSNPYTLGNLTPLRDQEVSRLWWWRRVFYTNIVDFKQHAAYHIFPWSYDFENEWESVGVPLTAPLCWNNIDMFNTTYKWVSYTTGGLISGCARLLGSSSIEIMIFNYSYLTLTGNEQLRFWVKLTLLILPN